MALENRSCCGAPSSCCGSGASIQSIGEMIGYSKEEMNQVPEGANLGLGCGNPVALASLREGQTVLDLGSGAGFDCFLAAKVVGETGRVIGVEMTPEMVAKARGNAIKGGYHNVEFRLGDIEHLPVIESLRSIYLSSYQRIAFSENCWPLRESPQALACGGVAMALIRTLSTRWPSISTTSNRKPPHSKCSPAEGIRPRQAITRPPKVW